MGNKILIGVKITTNNDVLIVANGYVNVMFSCLVNKIKRQFGLI